jgi:hypothetical protein
MTRWFVSCIDTKSSGALRDGQITSLYRNLIKPFREKYSHFRFSEICVSLRPSGPARGRFGRSSRNVGRDAMDAEARWTRRVARGRRNRVVLNSRRWDQA